MKRILAGLLAALLLLTLVLSMTACGEKEEEKDSKKTSQKKEDKEDKEEKDETPDSPTGSPIETLYFDQEVEAKHGKIEKELDPQEVYANLTYTPQMFYGTYRILGGEEGEKEYAEQMPYTDIQYYDYGMENKVRQITTIPFSIEAGPKNFNHVINNVKGKNFMRAYFYNETGNLDYYTCVYTVEGNTLTLNPLAYYEYDKENNHIRYLLSETVLTYQFQFEGRKLTLSDGENSVTMHSAMEVYTDDTSFFVDNYLASGSASIEQIDNICMRWYWGDGEYTENTRRMSVQDAHYENYRNCYAVVEDNGLLTMTIFNDDGTSATYQFVYIFCDWDGIILTDGEEVYYYTADWSDRYGNQLEGNLSFEDMDKLENMSEEKLEQIVEKKENLLTDLAAAFEAAGLSVTINEETGEIAMDASVLFPVDEFAVSEEGKALLEQFIGVYTSVVFDEKYEGFLSKIMVEGHTDSTGDYDHNQTLSQNRADSVKDFCISVGGDNAASLEEMMQAVGFASDKPILDANGKENLAASRRVSFRFVINLSN